MSTYFDENGKSYIDPAMDYPYMMFGTSAYKTGSVHYTTPDEPLAVFSTQQSGVGSHPSWSGGFNGPGFGFHMNGDVNNFDSSPPQRHYGNDVDYTVGHPSLGTYNPTMGYTIPSMAWTTGYGHATPGMNTMMDYGYLAPQVTPMMAPQNMVPFRSQQNLQPQPLFIQNENIDKLRRTNDLFSFINQVPTYRRINCVDSPMVDIVEECTGKILLCRVPKKMLTLFLGRNVLVQYLRTLEREGDSKDPYIESENGNDHLVQDEGVPKRMPVKQQLRLPRYSTSHAALKIMFAWMRRACDPKAMDILHELKAPNNLFSAITLARTLRMFKFRFDAERIDSHINLFLKGPLHLDVVKATWKLTPKDNMYTYRLVEALKENLEAYQEGHTDELPELEELMKFFDAQPELRARVYRLGENDKWKPVEHEEYMRRVEDTRSSRGDSGKWRCP